MTFIILNIVCRLALILLLVCMLTRFRDEMHLSERFGLGLMGGSGFLTIALIWDRYKSGTPFDGWATTLFTLGAIFYFGGRMWRLRRHEVRNEQQRAEAQAYFARKDA